MRIFLTACLACLLSAGSIAEPIVGVSENDTDLGDVFNGAAGGSRLQMVFLGTLMNPVLTGTVESSDFDSITISSLTFRADKDALAGTTVTAPGFSVYVTAVTIPPASMTDSFTSAGFDSTTATPNFTGVHTFTYADGGGVGPEPFETSNTITLTTPFVYTPSPSSHLLIEIVAPAGGSFTPAGSATLLSNDFGGGPGVTDGDVISLFNPISATAPTVGSGGLVSTSWMPFEVNAVPEPGSMILLGIMGVGAALSARRRREEDPAEADAA